MAQAQEYTISNVYPVMKADKVTQSSFTAHGNELFKWRLFFEGVDGHYVTNRKEDNAPKKGDVVYGTFDVDQFGNNIFKSESRPLGEFPARKAEANTVDGGSGYSSTSDSELEAKVDYLITLTEQIAQVVGAQNGSDDKPIDLSDIPFN